MPIHMLSTKDAAFKPFAKANAGSVVWLESYRQSLTPCLVVGNEPERYAVPLTGNQPFQPIRVAGNDIVLVSPTLDMRFDPSSQRSIGDVMRGDLIWSDGKFGVYIGRIQGSDRQFSGIVCFLDGTEGDYHSNSEVRVFAVWSIGMEQDGRFATVATHSSPQSQA